MFEFGDELFEGDFALFPVDDNGCPDEPYYVELGDGVWALRSDALSMNGHQASHDHNYQG